MYLNETHSEVCIGQTYFLYTYNGIKYGHFYYHRFSSLLYSSAVTPGGWKLTETFYPLLTMLTY
jgi:hypothetical protein